MPTKLENGQRDEESQVSTRILIGLIAGAIIGAAFNYWGPHPIRDWILDNICQPIGTAFLRGLFMVVVPLVFCSLVVGVANLGSAQHVGRLAWRLGAFYVATTLVAVVIGQTLISTVRPGDGLPRESIEEARSSLAQQVAGLQEKSENVRSSLWPGLVETIIPKNIVNDLSKGNMLAIIFVALLLGVALLSIERQKAQVAIDFFDAISQSAIRIVGWIMSAAPVAVAALIVVAVSNFGMAVMKNVLAYMVVVFLGYGIQFFGTYGLLVKFLLRIPLKEFYRRIFPIVATAFSTSSSSATMPTTIRTLEKRFGVPESLTSFSIPLGATVNMDGTALFEVVAALFIAQVFGVPIDLMGQLTLVVLVLLTSIGVAGVPGGSIPILMSAMASLGIPPEGIALVLGVDRLLDMGRTIVNVTGDSTGALFLARVERVPLEQHIKNID